MVWAFCYIHFVFPDSFFENGKYVSTISYIKFHWNCGSEIFFLVFHCQDTNFFVQHSNFNSSGENHIHTLLNTTALYLFTQGVKGQVRTKIHHTVRAVCKYIIYDSFKCQPTNLLVYYTYYSYVLTHIKFIA